jgi:hypothetical protein
MHLVATKAPAPPAPLTKQQKRKAKRQRKRERDYRLLAHARTELKQHYHLTNHETANVSALLNQMHNDRHYFATNPTQPPPKVGPPQRSQRLPQPPVRLNASTNQAPSTTKKTPTPRYSPTHHPHTPSRCDPHNRTVAENRTTKHTARRETKFLKKQKQAQIQEKLQTKHQPDHTNMHYNSKNDKKTKSPKPKMTQNRSATQLHRTKTTTAIVTTKFWPTSSGSSEFGHPESITVEFLPTHHPEIPRSQFNFLDTKEHQPTMPQHAKMDVIRTKQSDIVSTLVTLSKYTAKVYTPMTPHQFHLELQTIGRMKNLSTRASVTARTGQNLAPRVGPYAYYYRLFEDFYEIIQMEYDKLLTQ